MNERQGADMTLNNTLPQGCKNRRLLSNAAFGLSFLILLVGSIIAWTGTNVAMVEHRKLLLYEKTLENIRSGVIVTDGGGKILEWNPYAEDMLGWKRDEILGQSINSLMPTSDNFNLSKFTITHDNGETMKITTVWLQDKQGNPLSVVLSVRRATFLGSEYHFLTIDKAAKVSSTTIQNKP